MSVHYCVIARDSDMIVFEILVNKEMNPRQLKSETMEIVTAKEEEYKSTIQKMNSSLSKIDQENPEPEVEQWCEKLTRITGGFELNLMLQTGVFFGIVTDLGYGNDRAKRFLNGLHDQLVQLYKGNLKFIARQANLKPNCYDKTFKPKFQIVYDNNNTGIKSTNLNQAIEQVKDIENIAARSIDKMKTNMAETEKLLANSQEINLLAQDFSKNANSLEQEVRKQSWWMCSKPCIAMFSGIGLLILILWLILKLT